MYNMYYILYIYIYYIYIKSGVPRIPSAVPDILMLLPLLNMSPLDTMNEKISYPNYNFPNYYPQKVSREGEYKPGAGRLH